MRVSKKGGAEWLTDFRPLRLVGGVYKHIVHVLVIIHGNIGKVNDSVYAQNLDCACVGVWVCDRQCCLTRHLISGSDAALQGLSASWSVVQRCNITSLSHQI